MVLDRIMHLIKRREENGPRVDVGPMFRGEPPRNLSDAGVIAAADTVNRLPSRDYLGEEPGDLAPNPTAEEQRWTHERELYKKKNEGSPPDVPEELPQPIPGPPSEAVLDELRDKRQ